MFLDPAAYDGGGCLGPEDLFQDLRSVLGSGHVLRSGGDADLGGHVGRYPGGPGPGFEDEVDGHECTGFLPGDGAVVSGLLDGMLEV